MESGLPIIHSNSFSFSFLKPTNVFEMSSLSVTTECCFLFTTLQLKPYKFGFIKTHLPHRNGIILVCSSNFLMTLLCFAMKDNKLEKNHKANA